MKKSFIIMLFFLLSLLGCGDQSTTDTRILEQPNNLRIEGTLVSWDEVDNAESYQIFLNDFEYITNDNYYLIAEEGEYEIYVIARADDYLDSEVSLVLTAEIDFNNLVEFNFEIDEENKVFTWNEIEDVESYRIYLNGDLYTSETNAYSYIDNEPGLLSIRIQGIYPIGETNTSKLIYVEHNLEEISLSFQYSKNSSQNILILNEDINDPIILDETKTRINNDQILEENEYLEIKSEYLLAQENELVTFNLYSNDYKYVVKISLNNKVVPYLISSSKVYTDGTENIVLQFEIFDGNVREITGSEISLSDYSVQGNLVTINKDFIETSFSNLEQISLTYVLETEELVFGFLVIYNN